MIKARYGIPSASTGAMLRAEMRMGTPLGIEADRVTRGGSMVPDAMVIGIVDTWLSTHSEGFVFDGFPRTVSQAEALDQMLARRQAALDVVLFFDITHQTIFERVMNRLTCSKCGRSFAIGLHVESAQARCPGCGGELIRRSDDTAEALEQRILEYREKTEPLVVYYRQRGLLWPLRKAARPEGVFAEVQTILEAE